MQALYALIVMYLNNNNNNTTAKKQTSDCALFDLWESKGLFSTQILLFLFNTQIYQWSHHLFSLFRFALWRFKLNIFLLWSQYWNTQTRSNLWVSADWVLEMFFHLWEELKAPKNKVIVAPFPFEQRCLCRRSYSKALSFFLSDCFKGKKTYEFSTRTGYALRLTLYLNTNAVLTDTCVPLIGQSRKVQCQVLGSIEKYRYVLNKLLMLFFFFLFLFTPSILVSNP